MPTALGSRCIHEVAWPGQCFLSHFRGQSCPPPQQAVQRGDHTKAARLCLERHPAWGTGCLLLEIEDLPMHPTSKKSPRKSSPLPVGSAHEETWPVRGRPPVHSLGAAMCQALGQPGTRQHPPCLRAAGPVGTALQRCAEETADVVGRAGNSPATSQTRRSRQEAQAHRMRVPPLGLGH